MRQVHLARLAPASADGGRHEPAVSVVFDRAAVVVSVGHEDVALRIGHDIARTVERVGMRRRDRRDRRCEAFERLVPAAQNHFGSCRIRIPLDNGIGALVNRPDEILCVNIHAMRHRKRVGISSDLPHEGAILIELKQPRGVAQPRKHIHRALCELRAIPIVSPRCMPAGSLRKFGSDRHGDLRRCRRGERVAPVRALRRNRLENGVRVCALHGHLPLGGRRLLRLHAGDQQERTEAPH